MLFKRSVLFFDDVPDEAIEDILHILSKKRRLSSIGNILFFDNLPDSAMDHVLHFLSAKPQHTDWAVYVPCKIADALMLSSGSLSRVSQKHFRLWFDELPDCAVESILRFLSSDPRQGVSQVPGDTALSLVRTRGSLRRVSRSTLSSVLYYGKNSEYEGKILSSVSLHRNGLHDLLNVLVSNAVASNCKNLRSLELTCQRGPYSLEAMWRSLGTKLETLMIRTDFALGSMHTHCPNVSYIFIDLLGLELDTEEVCESFGQTLRYLDLDNFPVGNEGLTTIAEACPNEVLDCLYEDKKCGMTTDNVLSLGPAADSWEVCSRDEAFDYSLFSRVGISCANLR